MLTSAPWIIFHQIRARKDAEAKERNPVHNTKPLRTEHSLVFDNISALNASKTAKQTAVDRYFENTTNTEKEDNVNWRSWINLGVIFEKCHPELIKQL